MLAEKHRKKPEENRYKKDIVVKKEKEELEKKLLKECTFMPNAQPKVVRSDLSPAGTRLYDEAMKKKQFKKTVKTTEQINDEKNVV